MFSIEKLLGNIFESPLISLIRLLTYAKDHQLRLTKKNPGGIFTAIIAELVLLISLLEDEVGSLDSLINLQLGKTQTVDDVVAAFSKAMSRLEGFIAHAVGGRENASFFEFYPHGISEYSRPGREEMLTLTLRVKQAANNHRAQLGDDVADELVSFEDAYKKARNSQLGTKTDVTTHRENKGDNRLNLENGLVKSLHTVGAAFPGDIEKCAPYFNFNILFVHPRHKHNIFSGNLLINETKTVLNKTLNDRMGLEVTNTGTNANIIIWLAATATTAPNAHAVTILPGKTVNLLPSDLGELSSTFLLVKNESNVNEAMYEVVLLD